MYGGSQFFRGAGGVRGGWTWPAVCVDVWTGRAVVLPPSGRDALVDEGVGADGISGGALTPCEAEGGVGVVTFGVALAVGVA